MFGKKVPQNCPGPTFWHCWKASLSGELSLLHLYAPRKSFTTIIKSVRMSIVGKIMLKIIIGVALFIFCNVDILDVQTSDEMHL